MKKTGMGCFKPGKLIRPPMWISAGMFLWVLLIMGFRPDMSEAAVYQDEWRISSNLFNRVDDSILHHESGSIPGLAIDPAYRLSLKDLSNAYFFNAPISEGYGVVLEQGFYYSDGQYSPADFRIEDVTKVELRFLVDDDESIWGAWIDPDEAFMVAVENPNSGEGYSISAFGGPELEGWYTVSVDPMALADDGFVSYGFMVTEGDLYLNYVQLTVEYEPQEPLDPPVPPVSTPVPATIILLGMGLAGIAVRLRGANSN